MKWIFALFLVGILLLAGCPQEEHVVIDSDEEEEEEYQPPPPPLPGPQIIEIGFVGPLSGEHSTEGHTALNALRLAASELSTETHVFEIVEQDGLCTKEGAATALTTLVDFRGIDSVIGAVCPEEVDGMIPLLQQNGVVLISLSSGNMDNDYVMDFAGVQDSIGMEMAQFCLDNEFRRTMVVTDGSKTSLAAKDLFDEAAKELGLSTQPAQVYDENFASTVSILKGYQPEVVLVSASGETSAAIVNDLRAGGINSEILGDSNLISQDALFGMDSNSEGIYAILPSFDAEKDEARSFMNAYVSRYGTPSSTSLVADARDSLNLLMKAKEFYGYLSTTQDIQQYWLNLDTWEGMGGTLTFENGDRVVTFRVVQVENGSIVPA